MNIAAVRIVIERLRSSPKHTAVADLAEATNLVHKLSEEIGASQLSMGDADQRGPASRSTQLRTPIPAVQSLVVATLDRISASIGDVEIGGPPPRMSLEQLADTVEVIVHEFATATLVIDALANDSNLRQEVAAALAAREQLEELLGPEKEQR